MISDIKRSVAAGYQLKIEAPFARTIVMISDIKISVAAGYKLKIEAPQIS